jgi:hypothetical protein
MAAGTPKPPEKVSYFRDKNTPQFRDKTGTWKPYAGRA